MMISEYATLSWQTHRVNPIKWEILWDSTTSDDDNHTIIRIEFTYKPQRIKRHRFLSLRFIGDMRELENKLDDLCDKYYYEILAGINRNTQ